MASAKSLRLNNGADMPLLGLGTWQAGNGEGELEKALDKALETGYRHFDTANSYGNEKEIGTILKKWIDSGKVRREELFIVTKLPACGNRSSAVEKYLKMSLQDLQLDYVDLYLVHHPVGFLDVGKGAFPTGPDGKFLFDMETDHISLWKAMEEQVDAGRTKAIGLSNFNEKQIQNILNIARIRPANLQIELHAYFQQRPLVQFCHQNDVSIVAYAPLGSRGAAAAIKARFGTEFEFPDVLNNEVVLRIGKKHKKTAAQILLRHILQNGIAAIPKSSNPERIVSNFQVFDFVLEESDMDLLNKLDQGAKGRAFDLGSVGYKSIFDSFAIMRKVRLGVKT